MKLTLKHSLFHINEILENTQYDPINKHVTVNMPFRRMQCMFREGNVSNF